MKQCLELMTVEKTGIKFNFVLNPVRFQLTRLLLQFILALIGVSASERFQILLKNSKKKKKGKKQKKQRNKETTETTRKQAPKQNK